MTNPKSASIRFAFYRSLPVLCGYVFLGIAFGILLAQAGFGFLWALAISGLIFAGSLQFILVPLMAAGAGLATVAATTLFVNSRHLFYGLSFLDTFKNMGKAYPYMVFSLTDETYSVLCSVKDQPTPSGTKREWLLIAIFHHCYWVSGSVLGALIGQLIPFDFTGIDFSMTALFVVILIDQIRGSGTGSKLPGLVPAAAGLLSGLVCLLLFGADGFLLPALVLTVALLFGRDRLQTGKEARP